jgi:hypothetical protein
MLEDPPEMSRALIFGNSDSAPSERQSRAIMLHLHQNGGWIRTTRAIANTIRSKASSVQQYGETEHGNRQLRSSATSWRIVADALNQATKINYMSMKMYRDKLHAGVASCHPRC